MNVDPTPPRLHERITLKSPAVRTFVACLIILSLSSADQSLFGYAIPSITQDFAVPLTTVGTILSLAFLAAMPTSVFAGLLSDRWGRRPVIFALLVVSALCVGLIAFVHSVILLAILRIVGFASGGCMYPLTGAAMIEAAPDRFRGLFTGVLQIGYPLGFALGSLAVTALLPNYGWRALFLPALAVPLLVPLLYFMISNAARRTGEATQTAPAVPARQRFATLFSRAHRRTSIAGFCGSFFSNFAIGSMSYFLPTYLVQSRGLSPAVAGSVIGGSYLLGAIGYVVASVTGEFLLTRRNTLVLWIALGGVLFSVALGLPSGTGLLLPAFSTTIFFLFGSEGVRIPLLGELYPSDIRATAMSTVAASSVAAALLVAPIIVTHSVGSLGWTKALYLFGGIPLLVSAASYACLPNPKSGQSLAQSATTTWEEPL